MRRSPVVRAHRIAVVVRRIGLVGDQMVDRRIVLVDILPVAARRIDRVEDLVAAQSLVGLHTVPGVRIAVGADTGNV